MLEFANAPPIFAIAVAPGGQAAQASDCAGSRLSFGLFADIWDVQRHKAA